MLEKSKEQNLKVNMGMNLPPRGVLIHKNTFVLLTGEHH